MTEQIQDLIFEHLDVKDLNSDELIIFEENGIHQLKSLSLKSAGLSWVIKQPKSYKRTLKKVINLLLEEGKDYKRIAREIGITVQSVRKLLKEKG